MKVNDIVYLVYDDERCLAYKVQLLSEFVKSARQFLFDLYGTNCQAQFLEQYNILNGWQPQVSADRHFEKTNGIYRVSKKNLYPTWEAAAEVMKGNLKKKIDAQIKYANESHQRILESQKAHTRHVTSLEQLKQFNIETHFYHKEQLSHKEQYISPFTGLPQ